VDEQWFGGDGDGVREQNRGYGSDAAGKSRRLSPNSLVGIFVQGTIADQRVFTSLRTGR